jgi:hypothetical protein
MFQTFLKTYKYFWTLANKRKGVSKEDLAHWVLLALKKTLTPTNICKGFSTIGIWSLNFECHGKQNLII